MKNVLSFLCSYALGFAFLYIPPAHQLLYFLLLSFYLTLQIPITPERYRRAVIEPVMVGLTTVAVIYLLANVRMEMVLLLILMNLYVLFYGLIKGKPLSFENDLSFHHRQIKALLIPTLFPVFLFFTLLITFNDSGATQYLYWIFYTVLMVYFTKGIQNAFYASFLAALQLAANLYIFTFMTLTAYEKMTIVVMVAFLPYAMYLAQKKKQKRGFSSSYNPLSTT